MQPQQESHTPDGVTYDWALLKYVAFDTPKLPDKNGSYDDNVVTECGYEDRYKFLAQRLYNGDSHKTTSMHNNPFVVMVTRVLHTESLRIQTAAVLPYNCSVIAG